MWVEVLFGRDGVVEEALVVRGLGFGLDEEALAVVWRIEFTPGQVGSNPASVWSGVSVRFRLADDEENRRREKREVLERITGVWEAGAERTGRR